MKKHPLLSAVAACTTACLLQGFIHAETTPNQEDLLDFVKIFQGTDSVHDFSHGNTLPLTGMLDWSMQNDAYPCFFLRMGRSMDSAPRISQVLGKEITVISA